MSNDDRLDCITILPPGPACNLSLRGMVDSIRGFSPESLKDAKFTVVPAEPRAGYVHSVKEHGLPSRDCPHPDCLVESVHER